MELKFYTQGKRRKRKSNNAKVQTKYKTIVLDNLVREENSLSTSYACHHSHSLNITIELRHKLNSCLYIHAYICVCVSTCLYVCILYGGETANMCACLKRWEVDVGCFPQLFSTVCVCKREIGSFNKFEALQTPGSSCLCLSSFGKISMCPHARS